jgi:hypothetical protein
MAEDKIKKTFVEELKNKLLICKDCKRKFIFTIDQQKFYGQKGYKDPIRCEVCRRHKKILKQSLKDGISISENVLFEEICDMCGRKFFTKFKRRNENIFCDDCWTILKKTNIKYGNKKIGEKGQGMDKNKA